MNNKNELEIEKFVFDNYLIIERYAKANHWYDNVWRVAVEVPKRFFLSFF